MGQYDRFEIAWYSSQIKEIRVRKAVVEYMDGSQETIPESSINSSHMKANLDNLPYASSYLSLMLFITTTIMLLIMLT